MPDLERTTVTLPGELLRQIDLRAKDRSQFVADAVRNELERIERQELRLSIEHPHPDGALLEDAGFDEWARGLPCEKEVLLAPGAGKPVRWTPGVGWSEDP